MGDKEYSKIPKFSGRSQDDYNLWRLRAEIALKGKGYWKELLKNDCSDDFKKKASASALRVWSSHVNDPMKMLKTLDARYASTRAATRISVLTTILNYEKRNRKMKIGSLDMLVDADIMMTIQRTQRE